MAVLSCSEKAATDEYVPTAPFTLSVDKPQIESDGKQVATFAITDATGVVLTDMQEMMAKVYFINEATGERLAKRTKEFRSVDDGEFTFSATVSGEKCSNTVTVTSSGRSKYEVFRKNVAVYRFTATWCPNCPSMTKGFDKLSAWAKGRIVELSIHGAGSEYAYSDGTKYVADYLYPRFNAAGFPSCVYDLSQMSETRSQSEIETIVFDRISQVPASCGIKASSTLESGTLTISSCLKSSTGGKYDIGFAVLRDNCIPTGSASEAEYDNVVVALTGNYEMMSTSAFQLEKDQESAPVVVPLNMGNMLSGSKQEDFFVVVFALKQDGNDICIDNIVRFPLGSSVDYIYN